MRFLGLDSSTQSLTALIVDTDTGEVNNVVKNVISASVLFLRGSITHLHFQPLDSLGARSND